ncbi:protein of unassigned function [Methylobacterium oryzae CBMB20]|uniref:Protein of unassigned function n=1 Tax=Methylobacterium oryzae CBMB20 TaxID=693986 RepID=A0A089NRH3_9HYPH|nr:protein of unassigned function [Methylobacterium oryzae CBMB20]
MPHGPLFAGGVPSVEEGLRLSLPCRAHAEPDTVLDVLPAGRIERDAARRRTARGPRFLRSAHKAGADASAAAG